MSIKVNVKGLKVPSEINLKAQRITRDAIREYTYDLHRVATLRTPVDEGNLETSGTKSVKRTGTGVIGKVSFKAINKGFNYAVKMHDGNYKLGKKSIAKSGKGARSKYSNETFKVGANYLVGTAKSCEKGYKADLLKKLTNSLDS